MANKKEGTGKKVIGGIALGLVLILLGGVAGGLLQHHYKWGEDEPTVEEQEDPKDEDSTGGTEIDSGEEKGVKLSVRKLMSNEYAEYGVSALAETAYTLTATVYPADAANKAIDWSVSFTDAGDEWASGKTVTDYVTVTPTSDGALTATVENIAAFGEQIKITVTSRDNPEATAECMVEYQQKFESLAGYISLDAESGEKTNFSSTADTRCYIDFPLTDDSSLEYLTHTSEISITPVGTDIYTLPMDYNLTKVEMKVAANINRGFVEYPANFIMSHQELSELTGVTYKNGKCTGKMQEFMGISDYSNGNISAAKSNLYGVLFGGNDSDRFSEYKLYYSINGEEKYFSFYLTYRLESLKTKVSAVTVDNERIKF